MVAEHFRAMIYGVQLDNRVPPPRTTAHAQPGRFDYKEGVQTRDTCHIHTIGLQRSVVSSRR